MTTVAHDQQIIPTTCTQDYIYLSNKYHFHRIYITNNYIMSLRKPTEFFDLLCAYINIKMLYKLDNLKQTFLH